MKKEPEEKEVTWSYAKERRREGERKADRQKGHTPRSAHCIGRNFSTVLSRPPCLIIMASLLCIFPPFIFVPFKRFMEGREGYSTARLAAGEGREEGRTEGG